MRIGVNRGHYKTVGAVGYIKETESASAIVDELIPILQAEGHAVIDCSVNNGSDYVDSTIFANTQSLDLLVSVHLNSFQNQEACGTEVCYISDKGRQYAERISDKLSKRIGTYNRGAKKRDNLYILSKSKPVAVLVEALFVSNQYDANKFDAKKIALGIAEGILDKAINLPATQEISTIDVVALINKVTSNPKQWLDLRANTPYFDEFIRKLIKGAKV